jgi:spore coat protein CotF
MDEKDMVNDILSMTKASLTGYAKAISECSNKDLRQTLQQIRDSDEQFQFQLYQLAEQKNYYQPAENASQKDIEQVKTLFNQGSMMN